MPKWIIEKEKWKEWRNNVITLPPTESGGIDHEQEQFTSGIVNVSKNQFKKSSNKVKTKFNKPWWNEECTKATALRRRAQRKMRRNPTAENIQEYRRLTASATRIHNKAKRESWLKFTNTINPHTTAKEVWNFINKIKGKSRPTNAPLQHPNGTAFSKNGRAEVQVRYYKAVMTKNNNNSYSQVQLDSIERAAASEDNEPYNNRFTRQEIERKIDKLDNEKAYGKDEIHNQFLKNLPPAKVQELLGIFNRSWTSGEIPKEWKKRHHSPLPKTRER